MEYRLAMGKNKRFREIESGNEYWRGHEEGPRVIRESGRPLVDFGESKVDQLVLELAS